jgi:hypothetical protein
MDDRWLKVPAAGMDRRDFSLLGLRPLGARRRVTVPDPR